MGIRRKERGYFFFSSRRRHTRYWRDWSSDVCSSDLLYFPFNSSKFKGYPNKTAYCCNCNSVVEILFPIYTICFSFFSLFSTVPVDISCVVSTALFFPIYSSSIFMLLHRQSQNYNIRYMLKIPTLQTNNILHFLLLKKKF